MNKMKGLVLLTCTVGVVLLTLVFFFRPEPIPVSITPVTTQMIAANEIKMQEEEKRQQAQQAARQRADLEHRLYRCQSNAECIIVDKDPCGCLRGPQGVTAINSNFSLEFSRLMQERYSNTQVCPSVASTEEACAPTARAVCQANLCKIIY